MDKPPVKITDSRSIPVAIKRYVLWRDGPFCVCGCGEVGKDFDHDPPWNLLEPKCHNPDWIWLRGKNCHRKKSGTDTTKAAKVKRLKRNHEGLKPKSKRPINSRGFDKDHVKKFDGSVVKRKKK